MRLGRILPLVGLAISTFVGCRWIAGVDDKTASTSSGGGSGMDASNSGGSDAGSEADAKTDAFADGDATDSDGESDAASCGGAGGLGGTSGACLTQCNCTCTDTLSDPKHCGSCNVACKSGQICDVGICGRSLFRGPGSNSPCAAKPDGSLYCWGANSAGQDLNGAVNDTLTVPALASALTSPIRYVAGTGYANCALSTLGEVWCAGSNKDSQIGNGANSGGPGVCSDPAGCVLDPFETISAGAVEIAGSGNWTGGAHFCARMQGGSVQCWGAVATCLQKVVWSSPTPVSVLTDAVQITAGAGFACALRADGSVWCWGDNCNGVLGQGDTAPHPGAVQVSGISGVTTIGAGSYHVCARAVDGIYCWGSNDTAQVGADFGETPVTTPALVTTPPGLADVVQLAGSVDATCALTSGGDIYCWGRGDYGLMGDGNTYQYECPNTGNSCALNPVKVALSGVVEIALGYGVGFARLAGGELFAWGSDEYGQLGNDTLGQNAWLPVPVSVLP